MKIKNIGFPVNEDLYERLKILCIKKKVTLKQFMINLIEREVELQEKELEEK